MMDEVSPKRGDGPRRWIMAALVKVEIETEAESEVPAAEADMDPMKTVDMDPAKAGDMSDEMKAKDARIKAPDTVGGGHAGDPPRHSAGL